MDHTMDHTIVEAIAPPQLRGLGGIFKRSKRLPPSVYSYFRELVADYRTLTQPKESLQADGVIKEILGREKDGGLTLDDVRTLETALSRLVPLEQVRSRVATLREEFRRAAGQARYDAYQRTTPPDPKTADAATLREDFEGLVRELHIRAAFIKAGEELRATLLRNVTLSGLLTCFVAVGVPLWIIRTTTNPEVSWQYFLPYIPAASFVMMAGACGGIVSMLRRLQSSSSRHRGLNPLVGSSESLSVALAPIIGSVAAFTLFIVFAGGVLKGELFPVVDFLNGERFQTVIEFIINMYPHSVVDHAKLLLWGFVAGFSERLVPDVLDRLAASAVPPTAARGSINPAEASA